MTRVFMTALCQAVLSAALLPLQSQSPDLASREAMYRRYLEFPNLIKGGSIKGGSIAPHWMADGQSFWYAYGLQTAL